MIQCKGCGHQFNDTKQTEVAMGAVECPKCGSVVDQEGHVLKGGKEQMEKQNESFFSRLAKARRPYIDNRGAVAVHNPAKGR